MTVPRWKYGEELERVESNVDFGNLVGFFVRLSVQRDDGGTEWVSLTPDEADNLAGQLRSDGKSVQLFTYPGDDHNISQSFSTAMARSVAFFNRILKA